MRRLFLALIVCVLSFSASGLAAALTVDTCEMSQSSQQQHNDCPPTCVTCGCCVQAIEPVDLIVHAVFEAPVSDPVVPVERFTKSEPRDVLHVPKR